MKSALVTEWELTSLQYASNEAEKIWKRARSIVGQLGDFFNGVVNGGLPRMEFSPVEHQGYIAKVDCEFGRARIKLGFSMGEDALLGRLILEREGVDHLDRITWTPVFCVLIPAEERWIGVGDKRVSDVRDVPYFLGASMLLAIINGARQ